jgi:hypothetical protein
VQPGGYRRAGDVGAFIVCESFDEPAASGKRVASVEV